MNKLIYLGICFFVFAVFAQDGWRNNEMEVKVFLNNRAEADQIGALHLQGDIYLGHYALLYVTPDELKSIKNTGLPYEITKENLNEYYKDFWKSNATGYGYSTYEQLIAAMDSLQKACPGICVKQVLGKSVKSRDICVLKISDNVSVDENEAEVEFDGGIHGDEVGGAENCMKLARELCAAYGTNAEVKNWIDNREIFFYVMINPDGRVSMSRANANGVDCNRDWAYMWNGEGSSPGPCSQPEIKLIRNFLLSNQIVIQVTYHSGLETILYPWGFTSATPVDRTHHSYVAKLYASSSGYTSFPVESSYESYQTYGETLDYSYGIMGTVGLTEEISSNKQATDIEGYYNKNAPAMKKMIEYAGYGVEGAITDGATRKPVAALVFVNNSYPIYSDPVVGDYHKFVVAGTYSIKVSASGYIQQTVSNVSVADKKSTKTDITLERDPAAKSAWAYRLVSVENGGTGATSAILGPNDGTAFTLGSKSIVIDMQYAIPDKTGNDFKVYTSGSGSVTISAGEAVDGPFKSLGSSTTGDFDLSKASLASARYLKVEGSGAKLDAIEGFYDFPTDIAAQNNQLLNNGAFSVKSMRGEIFIKTDIHKSFKAAIYDLKGKRYPLENSNPNINNTSWKAPARGIYIVEITSGNNLSLKEKVVVK